MQSALKIIDDLIFNLKLERLEGHKPLSLISKRSNIHAHQLLRGAVAFVGLVGFLSIIFFTNELLFIALSIIYPAYSSAKASSNDATFSKEGRLWLSYWACFGVITAVDRWFGFVLRHLPFYSSVRCLLLVWLYNRTTRGAEYFADHLFQPLLRKYGKIQDKIVEQAKEGMAKVQGTQKAESQ